MRTLILFTMLFSTIIAKAQNQELNFSFGHTKNISCVSFSNDGKFALSASIDKTIKLWETSSGKEIKTFYGFNSVAKEIEFFPKSNQFIVGFNTSEIQIIDIESKNLIKKLDASEIETQQIVNIDVAENAKSILIVYMNECKIWNLETNSIDFSNKGTENFILNARFFPQSNSKFIVSFRNSKDEAKLEIVDTKSNLIESINTENQSITNFEFMDSTRVLLSTNNGKTLKYNIFDKKTEYTFVDIFATEISSLALSQNKKYFSSGTIDGEISVWKIDSLQTIRRSENKGDKIIASQFSENQNEIMVCSSNGTLFQYNLTEVKIPRFMKYSGLLQNIKSTEISQDSSIIVSVFEDNKIRIYNLINNSFDYIGSIAGNVKQIRITNDNFNLFILTSENSYDENEGRLISKTKLYKYNLANKTPVEILNVKPNILQIELLEDNNLLLIYKNGTIESWDSKISANLNREFETSTIINVSDNKKFISIANENFNIDIIDLFANQTIILKNTDFINVLKFSNNNKLFVLTSSGKIKIYDIATQKIEKTIESGITQFSDVILLNENEILFIDKLSNKTEFLNLQTNKISVNPIFENVFDVSKSEKYSALSTYDGQIKIIENSSNNLIVTIYAMTGKNWIITTPNSNYNCNDIIEKSIIQMNSQLNKEKVKAQKKTIELNQKN